MTDSRERPADAEQPGCCPAAPLIRTANSTRTELSPDTVPDQTKARAHITASRASIATLVGILLTLVGMFVSNWHSCRSYRLSLESNRANLHVSDVQFVVDDHPKFQVVFENLGSMPARLLALGQKLALSPSGNLSFASQAYDAPTPAMNEVVGKGKSLSFFVKWGAAIKVDNIPVRSLEQLLTFLRENKQIMYAKGRYQYHDGLETRWDQYCKFLTADSGWQTCPESGHRHFE